MYGLSTAAIARLFLQPEATIAQRLVRAKRKIRDANIPFEIPSVKRLDERLEAVLAVVYLLFTAGYSPSDGDFTRGDELCEEALRLARVLSHLLPTHAELGGLTALMLLHHARRPARLDASGELRDLEEQDRALWNRAMIAEGLRELEQALARGKPGPYQIQAAVAALHASAATLADTDWVQIMALYEELWRSAPSAAVAVSLSLAEGMAFSPDLALTRLERFEREGLLTGYDRLPAARADLLRRAGRSAEAREAYAAAMSHARHGREERFLRRRAERCV
jgi:RNA polymerase sigma-70 factor (ECF subfamily)